MRDLICIYLKMILLVKAGGVTELCDQLDVDMRPNAPAMRLNVRAWKLMSGHAVCIEE